MYRQAIAVLTATSAALLAPAATAHAEDVELVVTRTGCSDVDGIKINVQPPPPFTGTVTADDIRALMESIVAGSSLQGFFAPGNAAEAAGEAAGETAAEAAGETAAEGTPLSAAGPTLPPIPNLPPLPWPFPSPSVTPAPGTSPASAATPASPAETMLEALVDRAIACARSTRTPSTQDAQTPETVTRYLEALVTKPVCAGDPASAPMQSPATLLDVLGVPRLLDTVLSSPLFCVRPADADTATESVLDTLGIIHAIDELLSI
ncbi:hypothetical protein ABZW11_14545 [Nonomuraea sp. NPDC004580]|uniref:hypothetical protein n=1 Tax=Nonomuraea sp. NPDC004580 TaxID=3154552 RepID=UPI0033A8203E